MISREEAFVLLKKYLKEPKNIRYSFAVETLLKQIAKTLDKNEEMWGVTGLLHNIDHEYTEGELEKRGNLSSQLLEGLIPEKCTNAIKANNYMHTDYIPITSLDKSLIAAAAICSLILATAQTTSSKKVKDIDLDLLVTKFNDESFAAAISRSRIELCVDLGMDIKFFLNLSLNSLKSVADSLNF